MARRRQEEPKKGAPEWMTTYGDMVTLILCFFVLLFSMSTLDNIKFKAFVESMRSNMGVMPSGPVPSTVDGDQSQSTVSVVNQIQQPTPQSETKKEQNEQSEQTAALQQLSQQLEEVLLSMDLSPETASVVTSERGVVVRLGDKVLFHPAQADLTASGLRVLEALNPIIATYPGNLRVEGHADPRPVVSNLYPTNWELSAARAVRVARYFLDNKVIEGQRISGVTYGHYRPIANNDTEEGLAQNRRVDIVFMAPQMLPSEAKPSTATPNIVPEIKPAIDPNAASPNGTGSNDSNRSSSSTSKEPLPKPGELIGLPSD